MAGHNDGTACRAIPQGFLLTEKQCDFGESFEES